ncbi:MAG TPA: zf-HC2 domain-containing protein, partial [Blastocatellia bacterium]|nr:zf-HC2 domain-containing protein [Blastocatellia bacterium]
MFRKHVKRDLSAYCNGELAENESRRISEHLLACQSCRREHEQISQGVRLAGELRKQSAPDEIWNGIEELIEGNIVGQDSTRHGLAQDAARVNRRRWARRGGAASGWLRAAAAAASFMVIIGAGVLIYMKQRPRAAWAIEVVDGEPRVGSRPVGKDGKLYVGQWLETDQAS